MKALTWHRRHAAGVLAAIALLASQPVLARGDNAATAAEALFRQAKSLLAKGEMEKACAKLDASRKLEPAVGTLLYLGDCYDKLGKTASAWAAFRDARSLAEERKDPRMKIADVRAIALKPRVSTISLKVAEGNAKLDGFALRRDGVDLPVASWTAAMPLDAQSYRYEASADGHKGWSREVKVQDGGAAMVVEVPLLASTAAAKQPADGSGDAAVAAPGASGWSTLQWAGIASGGVSVVSVVVGAIFGGLASASNDESLKPENCRSEALCTQTGLDLRDDAKSQASISTATIIAGGILAAGGATLFILSAPSADETPDGAPPDGKATKSRWQLVGSAQPTGFGMTLRGTW
jgi:hypothetical protein